SCTSTGDSMPSASDPGSGVGDIYAGQRPDEDPSLAVRNNGGAEPSTAPAPAGRREALLVLSFGGPEGPDDVLPFLEDATRRRGDLRAARGGPGDCPAGRDGAQHPARDGGRRRAGWRRLRGGAAGRGRSRRGRGRAGPVVRPGVAEPQRSAVRAVAGARRKRS